MKTWRNMMVALGAVMAMSAQVRAQVPQLESDVPRISEPPSLVIPWAIGAVAAMGILAIAFKNAKRNHLD
jgi:hypothetical protein